MPLQARIIGPTVPLAHWDVRRLLAQVLVTAPDGPRFAREGLDVEARVLSGGYSGALVLLVRCAEVGLFVVKCGPHEAIVREHGNRAVFPDTDEWLAQHRLAGVYGPVEVVLQDRGESAADLDGQLVNWSAICSRYIGDLTYHELDRIVDFAEFARAYVDRNRDDSPGSTNLSACFENVVELLCRGERVTAERTGRDLASFLPKVPWDDGVHGALQIASTLCPDLNEIRDFRSWYAKATGDVRPAPVADQRQLHGDARLANVLVNKVKSEVTFIDFGNSRAGHVYEDLVRVELDLILTTAPRYPAESGGPSNQPDRPGHELVQDSLLDTFALTLRDDLGLHDVQTDDRHARCLMLWRRAMAAAPAIGVNLPGAAQMYRWFLLTECLKRLRWIANNGEAAAGVDTSSLLRLICTLQRRLAGVESSLPAPAASPSDGLRALRCTAAYVPIVGRERLVNDKRNEAKKDALRLAARRMSAVRVVAETGFSYLAARGAFSQEVHELLQAGGALQVVIGNPWFLEAYAIAATYDEQARALLDTTEAEPVLHEETRNKFKSSIRGYLALRQEFREHVELRMTPFGVGATLLLTNEVEFFEPYFRNARRRRERLSFDSFELQFSSAGPHAKALLEETFDFYWRNSEPYREDELEERWRPLLRRVWQELPGRPGPKPRSP